MKANHRNIRIVWLALFVSILAMSIWLGCGWFGQQTAWLGSALLATTTLASAIVVVVGLRNAARHRLAWMYIDALCKLNVQDLGSASSEAQLPSISAAHPWSELLDRLRQRIESLAEAMERAEHARAAIEVRARRDTSQHERIERVLASLSEPVLAIDAFDKLVLVNDSARNLLQIDTDPDGNGSRPENRAFRDLVRCEALLELIDETRQHRTAERRKDEIELVDAKGEKHFYSATAALLDGPSGEPQEGQRGVVTVLRDISSAKAAQKRNAEFVSSVSHEMKTPLAGIKAYVELLADGEAEDEATREEFLDVISTQANRLQRLIDNLLNLARIEAGVVKVNKEQQSLNDLLEEAASVVQPAAEQKSIQLSTDLSPLYLGVFVDRDTMLQTAINLLSNAIKYTPDGGTVLLRSRQEDSHAIFEVEDNGVGLSPEDCERVFEKFYRVKKDSEMAPGTGLGLPLVKHIVEEIHNGQLQVTSELGEGSTFRVLLPLTAHQR